MPRTPGTSGAAAPMGAAGPRPAAGAAPPRDLQLMVRGVSGRWGGHRFVGPGQLRLTSSSLVVEAPHGASLRVALEDLTGAAWRTGSLALHGEEGSVTIEADDGLEGAWVAIVDGACPLPEFARGFRTLGSRRGGPPAQQARLLAPLLQLRRRLEAEREPERRVAILEAGEVRARLMDAVTAMAQDAHPDSPADRRGLGVELQEALAPVLGALPALAEAARRFHASGDDRRFVAWREWVACAAALFAQADRSWAAMAVLLPGGARP